MKLFFADQFKDKTLWNLTASFLLFTFILLATVSCEKDDICVDGDTPLLIIRFYNASDSSALKAVTNLRIIGIGNGDPVDTFTDRASSDSVGIPLRANEAATSFQMILNSAGEDGSETGNIDTLLFNYETKEVFISRACGFVANYDSITDSFLPDTEPWIQGIEIVNPSVTSQASAHVKIYH